MKILVGGEQVDAEPIGVSGLGLFCRILPGPHRLETRMFVVAESAIDRTEFWEAWKRLGGGNQGLVWEDGREFTPPTETNAKQSASKRQMPRWLRWLLGLLFDV